MQNNFRDLLTSVGSINYPILEPPRNKQLADYQFEVLVDSIRNFESNLDDNHEVVLKLASFGQAVLMNVTMIGYSNPSIIHFYGYVNEQKSELIQHVNQLSFLLMSAEKTDPCKPPNRIGFVSDQN